MALNISVSNTVSKDAGKAIRAGVKQYLEDGAQKGYNFSQEVVPEDRSTLRMSGYEPEWTQDGAIKWGYRSDHAAPMEFGTDPYWPPIKPLIEWGQRVAGSKSLGFYVQWKIAQEGIDAQPFMRPGAEVQEQWYDARDVREYIENELE